MFNLVKYELKGYYKDFIIILSIIILANLLLLTRGNWEPQGRFIFSGMITFATMVVVLIWNIKLFSRDMYEDSGYLLLTLPQKGWSILGAKLIASLIQAIIVGIVAVMFNFINSKDMINLSEVFKQVTNNVSIGFIIFMILGGLFEYIYFLLNIYFSISLSKVAIKKKKMGKLGGFVIFIVVSMIIGKVTQLLIVAFPQVFKLKMFTVQGELNLGVGMGVMTPSVPVNIAAAIFGVILFLFMYWVTSYIIENKLDF